MVHLQLLCIPDVHSTSHSILPIQSLRIGRAPRAPDSSNRSLCLIKLLNSSSPVELFSTWALRAPAVEVVVDLNLARNFKMRNIPMLFSKLHYNKLPVANRLENRCDNKSIILVQASIRKPCFWLTNISSRFLLKLASHCHLTAFFFSSKFALK